MNLNLGRWLKVAIVVAALFAGLQYARVYVNMLQMKKVMGDEALDARRNKRGVQALENLVRERLDAESVRFPKDIVFQITGTGDTHQDIVVSASYVEPVNLLVYKHMLPMTVTARADAPNK